MFRTADRLNDFRTPKIWAINAAREIARRFVIASQRARSAA
jgi:hypothetical protein